MITQLQTVKQAPPMVPGKKRDWVPAVAIVGGGGLLALGLFLFLKKPAGITPGGSFTAHFTFDYTDVGGTYILQVSLGHIRIVSPFFDHVEGLTWDTEIELPGPDAYEFDLVCDLPIAASPGSYDGEAGVRLPGADWLDFIIYEHDRGVMLIRE